MTKPGHRLYRLNPGLKRCSARACASSVVSTITTQPRGGSCSSRRLAAQRASVIPDRGRTPLRAWRTGIQRTGTYLKRILAGASPADLPIEQTLRCLGPLAEFLPAAALWLLLIACPAGSARRGLPALIRNLGRRTINVRPQRFLCAASYQKAQRTRRDVPVWA